MFQAFLRAYFGLERNQDPFVLFSYFRNSFVLLEMSSTGDFKNEITPLGLDDDFIRNV